MWPNPQVPAELVTFTEETLNGKGSFFFTEETLNGKGSVQKPFIFCAVPSII